MEYGQIAYNEWLKLPERFPNFEMDIFQIMPNHFHGIINLTAPKDSVTVGATLAVARNTENYRITPNDIRIRRGNPCGCPKQYGFKGRGTPLPYYIRYYRGIQIVGGKCLFGHFQIQK